MHNFEYLEYKEVFKLFRDNPTWWKFTVVRDLINSGVSLYKYICFDIRK